MKDRFEKYRLLTKANKKKALQVLSDVVGISFLSIRNNWVSGHNIPKAMENHISMVMEKALESQNAEMRKIVEEKYKN